MEESDKHHEVSRNSDDSIGNTLESEHSDLADYCGDLCTKVEISGQNSDTSDFNMFLEGDQILHDKNEVVQRTAEDSKKNSATSRKSERSNDNISTDNNKVASDLCTRSFPKENTKEKPQKSRMPFANMASVEPCRISDFFCGNRKTSDTIIGIKAKNTESSRRSAATITPISNTKRQTDTDRDASLECNSQTFTTDVYSDKSSNISSSNMKIPKKDSKTSSAEMFTEEFWRKIRSISNHQNLSYGDFMNCNADTSSNPSNYSQCSTGMPATDEDDRNYLQSALKSKDVNNILLQTLSDSNLVTHEDVKTSDRNSKSLNPDLNISNRQSEICHPNLKFLLSDQDLKPDKKSSVETEEALRNILKKFFELQDIHQDTGRKFSEWQGILISDDGTIKILDTETETSSDFKNTDDGVDRLKAFICSEDQNRALQNYPSGSTSIESKALTLPSNSSEYCLSDFKLSDSDAESDHSELLFSDSSHETKEREDSSNSMNSDDEWERLESLVDSEDPYLALENYFSSTNSFPSKAIKMSSNVSDCCHSDLTSDSNQDSKHDKRSSNESNDPITFQNPINTFIESSVRAQKVITAGECPVTELTLENDQINFVNALETEENENSTNSINTDEEDERLDALICSEDPEAALENYLSSKNSIPSKSSSGGISEFCRLFLMSSNNSTERPDSLKSCQEIKNVTNDSASFQGFVQKQDIADKESTSDLASDNYKVTSELSSNKMKNDATSPSERLRSFYRSVGIERSFSGRHSFFEIHSHFSKGNSKTYQSGLKFSNRDQGTLRFKQPKASNDEEVLEKQQNRNVAKKRKYEVFVRNPTLDIGRCTPVGRLEKTDNDSNDVLDVFKKVIKCHPIKKFEIPPSESANSEKSLEKLDLNSNIMKLYDTNEHRNILECFFNTDSPSIMTFDVTDCFSQNSSIICNGLIREYLDISAKVNLLLVKQTRKISDEEYELRINSLRSLDDELGYVSARLITAINDWVKQFDEISENFAQSRIGSRCLYHMGILRICVYLISILLKFTLEKQLELENYEHFLIRHHKRRN